MASIVYGAIPFRFQNMEQNTEADCVGKNSEAFTQYDPVSYSGGTLLVGGTTLSICGVVMQTVTMSATNNGAANVAPPMIPVDETTEFVMGAGNGTAGTGFNIRADVGTYWKLYTNTTGSVQIDIGAGVQTTTGRTVMIKKVDPYGEGTTGALSAGDHKALIVFVRRPTWIDQ